MLSHEIVKAIEQERQRGIESTLARARFERIRPGRRARMRVALLRWLGAVPAGSGDCPDGAPTSPSPAAAAKSPTAVTTRSA